MSPCTNSKPLPPMSLTLVVEVVFGFLKRPRHGRCVITIRASLDLATHWHVPSLQTHVHVIAQQTSRIIGFDLLKLQPDLTSFKHMDPDNLVDRVKWVHGNL